MTLPTLKQVRELFSCDPEKGDFTWLVGRPRGNRPIRVGDIAGTTTLQGYRRLTVARTQIESHRVAFLLMTGDWPPVGKVVDHRDGDRSNNRWSNLRLVTTSENAHNVIRPRIDNRAGYLGVRYHKGVWFAQINVANVRHHLGSFPTAEAAHEAYVAAKQRLHPAAHRGIHGPDNGVAR